jgi:hypothetical protein
VPFGYEGSTKRLLAGGCLILLLMLRRRSLVVFCMRIIGNSTAGQSGYRQSFLIQVFGAFKFAHVDRSFVMDLPFTMPEETSSLLIHFLPGMLE